MIPNDPNAIDVDFGAASNRWFSFGSWVAAVATAALNWAFPRVEFMVLWTLFAIALLFSVRGYRLRDGALQIRFLWGGGPAFPLVGLQAIRRHIPGFLAASFYSLGTGLFSHVGLFRHRTLGWYRAYFTNANTLVWLQFENKAVAVSPADPDAFVRALKRAMAAARGNQLAFRASRACRRSEVTD